MKLFSSSRTALSCSGWLKPTGGGGGIIAINGELVVVVPGEVDARGKSSIS